MQKLKYYKALDGVRGMAALMVMWFHFNWPQGSFLLNGIKKTATFGQTGVTLFFVLSGFLITRILLVGKNDPHYFSNFYIRRSLRIFPLYYLFLVLFYFALPFIQHTPIAPFNEQVYYWTYLQNFCDTFGWKTIGPKHFWSLAVEEHFYLFWPLVIFYLDHKNIKRVIVSLVGLSLLLRIVLLHNGYGVFFFTFTNLDALSLGALMAVLESEGKLHGRFNRAFLKVVAFGGFPVMIGLWMIYGGAGNIVIQAIKPLFIVSFYYWVICSVVLSRPGDLLNRFFSSRFLVFTGKISYGLYVFHPLVYELLAGTPLGRSTPVYLGSCVVISFGVAILSFNLYEKQFLKLKDRFQTAREKKPAPAPQIAV